MFVDLNQDGLLDIVAVVDGRAVTWYQTRLDLTQPSYVLGVLDHATVTDISVTDVDGDGDWDVVPSAYNTTSSSVSKWSRNDGIPQLAVNVNFGYNSTNGTVIVTESAGISTLRCVTCAMKMHWPPSAVWESVVENFTMRSGTGNAVSFVSTKLPGLPWSVTDQTVPAGALWSSVSFADVNLGGRMDVSALSSN